MTEQTPDRDAVAGAIYADAEGVDPDERETVVIAVLSALDVPALRAEVERLNSRLAVEEEAERLLSEHNDRLQEENDRLRRQLERIGAVATKWAKE